MTLPTDLLHKFATVGGLFLAVLSFHWAGQKSEELTEKTVQASRSLMEDELRYYEKLFASDARIRSDSVAFVELDELVSLAEEACRDSPRPGGCADYVEPRITLLRARKDSLKASLDSTKMEVLRTGAMFSNSEMGLLHVESLISRARMVWIFGLSVFYASLLVAAWGVKQWYRIEHPSTKPQRERRRKNNR